MNADRSVADVVQDIVRNLHEIVRSEFRLAKTEIGDEARRVAWSGAWILIGAAMGLCAVTFLLWTAAYLLATTMSMWAATLVVALAMAAVAGVLIAAGVRRLKQVRPVPERTVESIKENLEWMKHPAK